MTHNTDKVAIHRSLQSRLNMTFSVAGLPIVHTVTDNRNKFLMHLASFTIDIDDRCGWYCKQSLYNMQIAAVVSDSVMLFT